MTKVRLVTEVQRRTDVVFGLVIFTVIVIALVGGISVGLIVRLLRSLR